MRQSRPTALIVVVLSIPLFGAAAAAQHRSDRFQPKGDVRVEGGAAALGARDARIGVVAPVQAPTGYDGLTNGYLPQGPPYDSITEDNVDPPRSFNDARFVFEEVETAADGL